MTTGAQQGTDLGHFAGVVADIARTLESPHESDSRLDHVLGLIRRLVPCDRCALYAAAAGPDTAHALTVVPHVHAVERARLAEFLQVLVRFMDGHGDRPGSFDARAHLALPVIGLDDILGVLLVARDHAEEYEPHHLRLLSAICSQLGAYLTMVRLHRDTARQAALLADREQQLRGAARFREEFIGVVGHDLRNPLSAIQTGAHLLRQRARLEPGDAAVVDRMSSSADRMSRMIGELMDFARGRLGGGIPLRRTLVTLPDLCRDVVEEAQAGHGRPVRLDASGSPSGHWDRDRLAQLLANLVGNALQHSPPESAVTVTVGEAAGHAVLEVHNAGTPIPADHLAHIFEPFHRVEKAARTGLGLGLYIVERIVQAHGGTIAVTSAPDEGTTFSVRLPRRRVHDHGAVDAAPREPAS